MREDRGRGAGEGGQGGQVRGTGERDRRAGQESGTGEWDRGGDW